MITRDTLAATTVERQELALAVLRSLMDDGLMARVYDLFVARYDDLGTWAFAVWLKLTEAGKHTAKELANKTRWSLAEHAARDGFDGVELGLTADWRRGELDDRIAAIVCAAIQSATSHGHNSHMCRCTGRHPMCPALSDNYLTCGVVPKLVVAVRVSRWR
ncbi:hypothetical protein [Mycobacterium riyadhense]|uniref:Uncharacterized protein n=1 Tax=Mycobacterium riyadhense TaxID=486698 RepID=A0A653ECJ7_9MYCO|nr:hypothetical protein [Mycobacterium riyadhense]VTO95097.1 hypothetical protein BIN_B_00575 [Mycobacterium riyadhense]